MSSLAACRFANNAAVSLHVAQHVVTATHTHAVHGRPFELPAVAITAPWDGSGPTQPRNRDTGTETVSFPSLPLGTPAAPLPLAALEGTEEYSLTRHSTPRLAAPLGVNGCGTFIAAFATASQSRGGRGCRGNGEDVGVGTSTRGDGDPGGDGLGWGDGDSDAVGVGLGSGEGNGVRDGVSEGVNDREYEW